MGIFIGNGVRLFYFLLTDKDIPLFNEPYETERLKKLIKENNHEK